jgi:predicted negative regulator of RcsB-dependent stress response
MEILMKKLNEKQEKTLEKMKETRNVDYKNLRDLAQKRLDFVLIEKSKAEQGIKTLQTQLDKLLGAQIVLEELLK